MAIPPKCSTNYFPPLQKILIKPRQVFSGEVQEQRLCNQAGLQSCYHCSSSMINIFDFLPVYSIFNKTYIYIFCGYTKIQGMAGPWLMMFSHHPDQMSQRSKVSKIALWRCSLNVSVIVFVFLLVGSCFLMIPISFARLEFGLDGWKALNP